MLDPTTRDGCLRALQRALVLIRAAAQAADHARAEAIADAFHNLPEVLKSDAHGMTVAEFCDMFLGDLVRRYPDLQGLVDEVPR
jgi:hypothetical protein